jgi:hypothetical protein
MRPDQGFGSLVRINVDFRTKVGFTVSTSGQVKKKYHLRVVI